MISKERLKKEIDQMPDEMVEKVYAYLTGIKKNKNPKKRIYTFKLNGAFDHMNIRGKAYE